MAIQTSRNPFSYEYTNVGMIIFDGIGRRMFYRTDTPDRAIARGDWTGTPEAFRDFVTEAYADRPRHWQEYEKWYDSMGNCMSSNRLKQTWSGVFHSPDPTHQEWHDKFAEVWNGHFPHAPVTGEQLYAETRADIEAILAKCREWAMTDAELEELLS